MSKIDSIHINNFKFFNEQKPIKLEGKHLLLYGENGSGKSSIYWALYTLFEATLKDKKEEVEKYFKHQTEHDQSLINIHANSIPASGTNPLHYNSFVKVQTTHTPPKKYEISLLETDIIDNTVAKEINQASDFITYKVLYKFQDFKNGATMDLANIFINYILPYISFSAKELIRNGETISFSNASAMYEEIKKGPGKTTSSGKDKSRVIQVYKYSEENKKFNAFVKHFNDKLQDLIDFININAPIILKELGYDIDFELRVTNLYHNKKDVIFEFQDFKIEFVITSYLGKQITINRPQSFLNEAKITAIAVAIRLAILKRRVNEEAGDILKFIVFDDIMISLDMNNRDKLIDYLLNSENGYTTDYQLLFLTHDRSLFYYLKDKIRNNGSKDDWVYKEMYVDTTSSFEKPAIYDYPNKINKAEYFLQKHDYPACGIYLRILCEEILDRLYPDNKKYEIKKNNEGLYESKLQGLNDKISHLEWFCKEENIDYVTFKDLKTYKSVILNSLAHNDIHSPIYKAELQKVLNVLTELNLYNRVLLVKKNNSSFSINFTKSDGNSYKVGITIKDKLFALEKEGKFKKLSNICKANITYKNDNGVEEKDINIEKESIRQIVSETCTFLSISNDIIIEDSLIDRNGNAISIKINS